MAWIHVFAIATAGLGTMRAAIDRGDIDEAARQGSLAGPTVVEAGLRARDRSAQLAAIAAAPTTADRIELLAPLAKVAAGGDRRVALPAARAARQIARELGRDEPADDVAAEDLASWRDDWARLARDRDRWIELRVIALDTAIALDPAALDLAGALADPDPAYRRAAIADAPVPVPAALRATLAAAVAKDLDNDVALAAAAVVCADLAVDPPAPILAALGAPGVARIRSLAATAHGTRAQLRDANRCLAARRP